MLVPWFIGVVHNTVFTALLYVALFIVLMSYIILYNMHPKGNVLKVRHSKKGVRERVRGNKQRVSETGRVSLHCPFDFLNLSSRC